tara:strand:+ start:239304 stop:240560 length:1257 start_codon:yes stop_codon:yes gene_type:complete
MKFSTFIILFFSVTPTLVCAQSQDVVISLDEAATRTLSENPALEALGYQMQIQEARTLQAGIRPQPQLSVEAENFLGSGDYDMFSGLQTTFSISWILDRGIRQSMVNAGSARMPVIESEINIARLDAVAETARRYLDCLDLQTRMMTAREGIRLAEDAVEEIEIRVNNGISPSADLARANAELARRELILEDIEHELVSAYYRLGAQWGETEPSFTRVAGSIFDQPEIDNLEIFQTRLTQNPNLQIYLSQQRLNEAQLELEQSRNQQNWQVSAGFRRLEQTSDNAFVASFSMPLGNESINRGNIEAARNAIRMTELEAEAERVRLETELFVIYQELQHSVQLTAALSDEILPLYQQALEETQAAYELGRYSYLEWNSAQTDLLAAQNDLIEASRGFYINLIEIERLTGISIAAEQFTP